MFQVPDDPHVDLRQWLNNGVFCTADGTAHKYLGPTRGSTQGAHALSLPRSAGDAVTERAYHKAEVYLHWPLGGAVNNHDFRFAFIMQRLPRRQYARTFTHNQVECLVPRGFEVLPQVNRRGLVRTNEDDVLRAIFYPTYPDDYQQALRLLDIGWASVALSRRIILVRAHGKDLVFDGMNHVGHVFDGRFISSCSENHTMKVLKAFKGALQL